MMIAGWLQEELRCAPFFQVHCIDSVETGGNPDQVGKQALLP